MGARRSKDLNDLLNQVAAAGWPMEKLGSGHVKVLPPNGSPPLFISNSGSDWRAPRNTEARLRRAGLPSLARKAPPLEEEIESMSAIVRSIVTEKKPEPLAPKAETAAPKIETAVAPEPVETPKRKHVSTVQGDAYALALAQIGMQVAKLPPEAAKTLSTLLARVDKAGLTVSDLRIILAASVRKR